MAEVIFILFFAFPAILGLAEMLHTVRLWFVAASKCGKKILVVIPDDDNFERQLTSVFEEGKWQGERLAHKIVVVNSFLTGPNQKECELLAEKFGFKICSKGGLCDIVL